MQPRVQSRSPVSYADLAKLCELRPKFTARCEWLLQSENFEKFGIYANVFVPSTPAEWRRPRALFRSDSRR